MDAAKVRLTLAVTSAAILIADSAGRTATDSAVGSDSDLDCTTIHGIPRPRR